MSRVKICVKYLCTTIAVSSTILFIATFIYVPYLFDFLKQIEGHAIRSVVSFIENSYNITIYAIYVVVDCFAIKIINKIAPDSNEYHFAKYGFICLIAFGMVASLLLVIGYAGPILYDIKLFLK